MFGFRFIKFQPNEYGIQYRNGTIIKEGAGISFYYYAPVTSLVKLPIKSNEIPFIFEEVSEDFQTLTVQGQVIYRIIDHKHVANLLNYSIDVKKQSYLSDDPEKLSQRVINLVHVLTKKSLEKRKITDAIKQSELIAAEILKDIKGNEEVHQLAIENKRKEVKETQLEAKKVIQQKMNQMEVENLTFAIAQEEKKAELVERTVANAKSEADAKAYELKAMMAALEGIDTSVIQSMTNMGMKPDKLMALAFQQLAGNAGKIGQLNISPDLLQEIAKGGANG